MLEPSKQMKKPGRPSVKKVVKNVKKKLKITKKIRRPKVPLVQRGVVYLSHLPHGFYEDQIRKYFQQFGRVTAYNLPRSKSGEIKGYAFIEFQHPEVAKIAADTMNNYLMFDRLIKAKYIPPEEQKPQKFYFAMKDKSKKKTLKDIAEFCRQRDRKNKIKRLSKDEEDIYMTKQKTRIQALHHKLSKYGIDYDFQVDNGPVQLKKVTKLSEDKEKLIVEVDESDDEISFKTPPNAVKILVNKTPSLASKKKSKELVMDNKKNEKKEKLKSKQNKSQKAVANGSMGLVIENELIKKQNKKSPSRQAKKSPEDVKRLSQEKLRKKETKIKNKGGGGGGILKKFTKTGTSEGSKEKKSNPLGVKKNKGKAAKAESGKIKKKLKGLNLVGVKQMMKTFG